MECRCSRSAAIGTPSRLSASRRDLRRIVGTPSRQLHRADDAFAMSVEELTSPGLADVVFGLSWSHHCAIIGSVTRPEQHYFYMAMAVRERWSVRELRRQLDADLFTRYVSVKRDPEKRLPVAAEQGDLLFFHRRLQCLAVHRGDVALRPRRFVSRRLRGLKVAPEDVEIEAVEPVERAARAVGLALAGQQGDMKQAGTVQPGPGEIRSRKAGRLAGCGPQA